MKPKVIAITIDVYNDPNSLGTLGIDAIVEREREMGTPFNLREYEDIKDATFARLQEAQRRLLQRPLPEL